MTLIINNKEVEQVLTMEDIRAQTAVSDLPNSTNSPLFMLVTDVAGFDQIRPGIPKGLNPLSSLAVSTAAFRNVVDDLDKVVIRGERDRDS